MKKVVYIVSDIDKALAFEWIADFLNKEKFELQFFLVGKKSTALSLYLQKRGIPFTMFTLESKIGIPLVFVRIFFQLLFFRPAVVHTHLFYANLIGLTAAWLLRIKKRIFTRHHAMLHYREFKSGRKWDRWCNWIATDIIAVSENVRYILISLDKANPAKIRLIHHGFDLAYFDVVEPSRVDKQRMEYLSRLDAYPVIGVISRYIELKGIQYIIPAFKNVLNMYPGARLILANAQGSYAPVIKSMLHELPPGSFTEILFQNDLAALYKLFDVFIHASVDEKSESFGQTYVEALASGVPAVFTLAGVAPEFIRHEYNALVVEHKSAQAIEIAIKRILNDSGLRRQLIENGRKSVEQFSVEVMIANLENLYE